jgi:hypothetical protein
MAFHFSARSGAIGALLLAAGCMSGESTGGSPELAGGSGSGGPGGTGASQLVSVTTLTSDQASLAGNVNPSLVNAWGIVGFQGWFWITDNATGKLSILDGAGKPAVAQQPGNGMGQGTLNVASDSIDLGEGITGIAVNTSTAMQMDGKGDKAQVCGPANLIVASEKGQLIGVNTSLNATGGQVLVDRSSVGAAYLGVAVLDIKPGAMCSATGGDCDTIGMGSGSGSAGAGSSSGSAGAGTDNGNGNGNGNAAKPAILVLAADFHNARIDVFDEKFNLVTTPMFATPASIPTGFAPFNVAVINGFVYVAFAQQNEEKDDSVAGPGLGFVVAFDVCGNVQWIAKGAELNAPWGMVMSGNPGRGSLLVGNFGDGHITELNPKDGTIIGQLMTAANTPVAIDGLWGLALGTGPGLAVQSAKTDGVYFAAGPADETHGVFGVITAAVATPGPGSGSGSGM